MYGLNVELRNRVEQILPSCLQRLCEKADQEILHTEALYSAA